MNFTKLVALFAFVTLAVLSLGMASAQSCVQISNPSLPTSISNTAGTFQATFNLAVTGAGCTVNRTINTISLNSSTASGNTGSWTVNTNLPVSLNATSGSTVTIMATFTIPSGTSGSLGTSVNVQAVQANSGATESYIFTLPSVTITQPSSNITIAVGSGAPFTLNQNVTLTVTNTGTTNLPLVTMSQLSAFSTLSLTPLSFSLNAGSPQTVSAVLSGLTNLKFGMNTISVKADAGTQSQTASFDVKKTFCSAGAAITGNLSITNVEITNNGEGEDSDWELLDEIEVEIEVTNNNNNDDIDAVIELGLFDSSGKNVADDLVFLSDSDSEDEQIDININDGDEEKVTFKFKIPADFDADNYKLAIKTFDDDAGESRSCKDSASELDNGYFQSIDVSETSDEGRFIIIDEFDLESQVTCGQTLTGQFTIFNVGEEDQERVRITIRNSELNINEIVELTTDLDKGEDEPMSFRIDIPSSATNGMKTIEFIAEYDYKNGVYRQDADEAFEYGIEILGCSQNVGNPGTGSLTNLEIDAKLDSVAKAGKELVIIATIKNTGTQDATYSLSARGYSTWAELTDISDATISVDAGESKEVKFTLLVNEDSTGNQAFDIQVASEGRVQIQEVEVELAKSSSLFNISNPIVWVIGIVNLVLIILIIIVAVKLSRR